MNIKLERLIECCEKRTHRDFSWASDYAEPGYHAPEKGIVFGNWNPSCGFSGKTKAEQTRDPVSKLARVLEGNGFELEWEDQWITCCDCGKAVRTLGDCYGWTSYYRVVDECEVCLNCLDVSEYLASIENDPKTACAPKHDPEQHGYVKYNGDFETGFHSGQDDDPKKILARMQELGLSHVVFKIASCGQFDIRWQAYHKLKNESE